MKNKVKNLFLAASLLVGTLGFGGTVQAVTITGDTNASTPTTIATYLTYAGASFSLDVPVGPGPTSLANLGTFTLSACSGNNCVENFGTQDGLSDFTLKITFTAPTVTGSPEQFAADIFGTISRSGNSNNIGNGSLLTIDLDNTAQHLTYTNAFGSGAFDLSVNDPASYTAASQFGDTRTVTGQIANLTFTPATTPTAVPEPSTFFMLGSGLLVLAQSVRKKRQLS